MTPEDKNIGKLQRLLALMDDDGLTKAQFLDAFKKVVDYVKTIDQRNLKELDLMNKALEKLADKIDIKADGHIEKAKSEAIDYLKKETKIMYSEHEKMMKMCEEMMESMQDGADGKDADEEKITLDVIEKCQQPIIDKLEKELPQLGDAIRDGLEILQNDERLKIEAVKNLREELDRLEKKILSKTVSFGGGGGVGKHNVVYHDLSGSLNGSTRTFSLPAFYKIVDVKLNSVPVMRLDIDYTVDGSLNQITMTDEISLNDISAGQSCIILYSEN